MLTFVNNYVVICSLCNIKGADCMKNPLTILSEDWVRLSCGVGEEPLERDCFDSSRQIVGGLTV